MHVSAGVEEATLYLLPTLVIYMMAIFGMNLTHPLSSTS